MLRLLESLEYEGSSVTVLTAASDTWVAATEVGRALGLHDNTVRQVVQKNYEVFEPLTTTLEALWRGGATTSRVANPNPTSDNDLRFARDRADTLFLNYSGIIAVLLKLDTARIKDPEARARVVGFFRWALRDLKQAMLGRALPAGADGSANERPRLDARTADIVKAIARNGHRLPVSILVPLAASIGIDIDPAAVEAERAAMAPGVRSGSGRRAVASATAPADTAPSEGAPAIAESETEAERYLRILREVIAENRWRIAGLEEASGGAGPAEAAEGARGQRCPMPVDGYIGGVGRARGLVVIGLLPLSFKGEMARRGIYDQRRVRAALHAAGVLVGEPARRGGTTTLSYIREDGWKVHTHHLCFRMDRVVPATGVAAPAAAGAAGGVGG